MYHNMSYLVPVFRFIGDKKAACVDNAVANNLFLYNFFALIITCYYARIGFLHSISSSKDDITSTQ